MLFRSFYFTLFVFVFYCVCFVLFQLGLRPKPISAQAFLIPSPRPAQTQQPAQVRFQCQAPRSKPNPYYIFFFSLARPRPCMVTSHSPVASPHLTCTSPMPRPHVTSSSPCTRPDCTALPCRSPTTTTHCFSPAKPKKEKQTAHAYNYPLLSSKASMHGAAPRAPRACTQLAAFSSSSHSSSPRHVCKSVAPQTRTNLLSPSGYHKFARLRPTGNVPSCMNSSPSLLPLAYHGSQPTLSSLNLLHEISLAPKATTSSWPKLSLVHDSSVASFDDYKRPSRASARRVGKKYRGGGRKQWKCLCFVLLAKGGRVREVLKKGNKRGEVELSIEREKGTLG